MSRVRCVFALVLSLSVATDSLAEGRSARLPEGSSVVAEALDGAHLDIYLELPRWFLRGERPGAAFDEGWLDEWLEASFADQVRARADAVRSITPWVVDPDDPTGGWIPLPELLPLAPLVPTKPGESAADARAAAPSRALVAADAPGHTEGALSGKVVYVSAGHGFTWTATLGRWATQRGNTNGIVEDLVSAETVDQYLITYLVNAGATVFTVRERDMNPEMVIVDADLGGATTLDGQGRYDEEGAGWVDSSLEGFRAGLAPYQGNINPFTAGNNRVITTVSGAPTASARWTPTIPSAGRYHVYISYTQDSSRVKDAHYLVRHAGGQTELRVNQERHGRTWVDLGAFWFDAGQDAERGALVLYNDSALEPGDFISADAVRFGGGMGDADRGDGSGVADGPTSNRPRWEECSRYHIQFSGAPTSVYAYTSSDRSDDVGARSRYAAWQNEPGEDSVYIAWHTNAPNPGRGTSTYVYGPNAPDGSYNFTGVAGSDLLAEKIHGELIDDIRAEWDPGWSDRGIRSAYFGEVNPSHNPEMPAVLVEVAFHDTPADAALLKEPRFRKTAARAFYQGIVKYFAERDGIIPRLLPEPPQRVRVIGQGEGSAEVSWAPSEVDGVGLGGDAPTSYKVYRSVDGRGWDDGTEAPAGATSLTVTGLEPGVPAWFRVTALNAGGESFASPTVGVSTSCGVGPPPALLVYGFYRLDASSMPRDDLSAWGLGVTLRGRQDEANTFGYLVEHGAGFALAGVPFDSAEATAIEAGAVALAPYLTVDWILGEESTRDETFSGAEQGLVSAWLGLGDGRVLITSGAELYWDLDEKGSASDLAFAHASFGAAYAADRGEGASVVGEGALSAAGSLAIDDGSMGTYLVYYPDVLSPLEGASSVLRYSDGSGSAGVWFEGAGFTSISFGVPIEALYPASARDALLALILDSAGVELLPVGGCAGVGPVDEEVEPIPDEAEGEADVGPTPADTLGFDGAVTDAGVDGVASARALDPYRQTRIEERERDDGGCVGASGPSGGGGAWLLVGLLGLLSWRRSRGRPRVTRG